MDIIAGIIAVILGFIAGITPLHNLSYVAQSFGRAPTDVSVIFGGDMMFDRSLRTTIEERGGDYLFSCIDDVLNGADLVVANLEGPITPHPSKSVGSTVGGPRNFTFTFPMSTASLLYKHNIRVVNLGNNHIYNFHDAGVESTLGYLDEAGVQHFGDPLSQSVATTTLRGVPLAFINYNEFVEESTPDITIFQIEDAKAGGRLPVVYTHWGNEYVRATAAQKDLAHRFIDAGAEIVIGSHPHVIQEHEEYMGKHIYYSLGNLIFDQYWDEAVRTGLLIKVSFSKQGVEDIEEIKVYLERDRTTCPIL